jgi:hypothetical protein
MARKSTFLPGSDSGLVPWLQNLASKIGGFAAKYNIQPNEVTKVQEGVAFLVYWILTRESVKNAVKSVTAYKNEVRDGVKAGGSASVPPADILFTPPTAVDPGVIPFILSIVGRIKKHQGYTTADGNQMGLEGAEQIIDLLNLKPVFTVELESGKPTLVWTKGATDAVKIKVKRVIGPSPGPPPPINLDEFAFLAIDTQPDYTDTTPLPPYGETATWIYVMIYMMDDEEVGQWSEPVIVTVVGTP